MQLLEGVAHGWQQERIVKFFHDLETRSTQEQWLTWLQSFGGKLLASPAPNNELASRMVRLGEIGCGQLGEVAYDIGMQLLLRESRQPPTQQNLITLAPEPIIEAAQQPTEAEPVTLDELFEMLQNDTGLVEQIAAQLQLDTSDPQTLMTELINRSVNMGQAAPESAEDWFNQAVQQHMQGDLDSAIASYDRCLEINPHVATVWSNRGVALADLGRYQAAIASFERVLQIEPKEYWAWNNRGYAQLELGLYEEAIASFRAGLQFVAADTYPEAWAQMHRGLGNAFYEQGRTQSQPANAWRQATIEYEQAMQTFTPEAFPEAHLQVVQDLLKVYLSLGQINQAETLGQHGLTLLHQLGQNQPQSDATDLPLPIKFMGLNQLIVDLAVRLGQITPALDLAEQGKNACFTWFFGTEDENQIQNITWADLQQKLNPKTAIIYWYLSPAGLTTFIIKHNAPEPILLTTPTPTNAESLPISVQRLGDLETWIKDWNQQYQTQMWREKLPENLQILATILNVPGIIQQIDALVNNLILIPHRDLHRLPLHALFPDQFTISYLPPYPLTASAASDTQSLSGVCVECLNQEQVELVAYTQVEALTVSQILDNPTELADDVTKPEVIAALSQGSGVFHFTGRCSYDYKTPNQSTLTLTNQDSLTLEDISLLSLNQYRLVYLSASEIPITSKQLIGTEYIGYGSVFLAQGVANVVSTLWKVEDISRVLFTIEFYRCLKNNLAPVQALKQAQQWLRTVTYSQLVQWYQDRALELAQTDPSASEYLQVEATILQGDADKISQSQPPYAHPYHWAAFAIATSLIANG
jgi:CHAT domain-containing protein/Flp pilus assembly protein TadD